MDSFPHLGMAFPGFPGRERPPSVSQGPPPPCPGSLGARARGAGKCQGANSALASRPGSHCEVPSPSLGPGSPCSRNFVPGGCWSFRENTLREHRTDTKEMMALPFLLFCIVSLSPLTFQPYSENYSSPPKVTPFP